MPAICNIKQKPYHVFIPSPDGKGKTIKLHPGENAISDSDMKELSDHHYFKTLKEHGIIMTSKAEIDVYQKLSKEKAAKE